MALILNVTLDCAALSGEMLVTTATVEEAISQPTRATVTLVSPDDIDGEPAIGEPAHLQVAVDGAPVRHFQLVVTAFSFDGIHGGNRRHYTVTLEHELTGLLFRSDVRMFQEKDVKTIVAEVFDAAGLDAAHFQYSLQRTLSPRNYTVQYRETDFAFVSRLLAHEGIFYFIHDTDSATEVTIADNQSAFPPVDGETSLRLTDDDAHGTGIQDFVVETRAVPEQASVGDYNFNTPTVDLTKKHAAADSPTSDWFDYPAGHTTPDEGLTLARLRLERFSCEETLCTGKSDAHTLRAGAWFELAEAHREALSGKYLLTRVVHHLQPHAHEGRASAAAYTNEIECIPHATVYRPPLAAPRPRVGGLHSAVVTGPSGSEIHTDERGCMKGLFFWDRVGSADDKSSCWMRVSQLPIGGSMALARVGWEMAVTYFDGDPDRPLSAYRLYNAEKVSPYGYPASKTRMALQTPSSPASGKSNEIRMEDGGGGMEMFVNASKDLDAHTNNDKNETIGVDEKLEVGSDMTFMVGANQKVTVGASRTATITADEGTSVTADRTKTVGASETATVGGNITIDVKGSDTETTGGSHTTLAAMGIERTSTGSQTLTVGGSMIGAAGLSNTWTVVGAKAETTGGAKIVASGASVSESVVGALAITVGGAVVQAAAGNRQSATKGPAAVTVGGLLAANGAGKVSIKAKKVAIRVLGIANFLGGGGVLNMTPGSVAFVGMVTLDASGKIKISGNPNLVG